MRLSRYLELTVTALVIFFLTRGVEAAPMRISYSAISGAMSSLWVAQEGGYFRREGLDTELLYIGGGSLLIQSMLSGDVPLAYGPSVPVINASLRGSDLVLIGNTGTHWFSRSCRGRRSNSRRNSRAKKSG
jgi:ABC-type nitrate/sulfonate/bicarbonate transport system substrate-binding protein